MPEPLLPPADDKDWTWVVETTCPDCGYEPADVDPSDVPAVVQAATAQLLGALASDDATARPQPEIWSPLEYGAHVRDVHRKMTERLHLIEDAGGAEARFQNWDQDAAALEGRYWEQVPSVVAVELDEALAAAVEAWSVVPRERWEWRGLRSNGSAFTIATLGRYYAHDVVHHGWDVSGQPA